MQDKEALSRKNPAERGRLKTGGHCAELSFSRSNLSKMERGGGLLEGPWGGGVEKKKGGTNRILSLEGNGVICGAA